MTASPADTPVSAADIYEKIWQAIFERRLRPGTRLKEEELADIFLTTRARVRQALSLLERDRLVTLIPHRGGFVAKPTIEEARDVFFARRVVEGGLIERLCSNVTDAKVAQLQAHVARERDAHLQDDLPAMVRLSGAFHILIAELADSEYLYDVLRDLVSRTSLISAMYQPRQVYDCGPDEHEQLVNHIAAGEVIAAQAVMNRHLEHIEAQLDLNEAPVLPRDLREALR